MMALPLAHETWFERGEFPTDWGFAGVTTTIALLVAALGVTLAVRLLASFRDRVDVPFLAAMAPFMPFAIRIHLAVSLVGLLSLGYYLSPAMDLEADVAGILLGAVLAVVAIGVATGWPARAAGWGLVAAGAAGSLGVG